MKGLILEKYNNGAYILDNSGGFHSIKGSFKEPVGSEIEFRFSERKRSFNILGTIYVLERFALAAACLLLLIGAGGLTYQANTVCCYVYIDVNPSVELVISNLGQVISSQGVNEDGESLLKGHDIKGSMEKAIMAVLTIASDAGYAVFGENESTASITFVPNEDGNFHELFVWFSKLFSNNDLSGVSLYACDKSSKDLADSMGISPANLNASENLYLIDPDTDLDEILSMSAKTAKELLLNSFIEGIMDGGKDRDKDKDKDNDKDQDKDSDQDKN